MNCGCNTVTPPSAPNARQSLSASAVALGSGILVLVNYGAFAAPEDAEAFSAAALGLGRDDYYDRLCRLADQLEPNASPG